MGHPGPDRSETSARKFPSIGEGDRPRRGLYLARQHLDEHLVSAAGEPTHPDYFAGICRERNPMQRPRDADRISAKTSGPS